MKKAAVAKLKAELSRYLRQVKAGEEVLVTERNVPIARLVPVRGTAAGLELWRDLERQGLIKLGTGKLPRGFMRRSLPRDAKGAVRRAVREEREGGW